MNVDPHDQWYFFNPKWSGRQEEATQKFEIHPPKWSLIVPMRALRIQLTPGFRNEKSLVGMWLISEGSILPRYAILKLEDFINVQDFLVNVSWLRDFTHMTTNMNNTDMKWG